MHSAGTVSLECFVLKFRGSLNTRESARSGIFHEAFRYFVVMFHFVLHYHKKFMNILLS